MRGIIRLATDEERAAIAKQGSDLTNTSVILAWDPPTGGAPVFMVVRQIVEVDPWYFNGASPRNMWLAEIAASNFLKGSGVSEYYFRVDANDAEYQKLLENLGAENTSKGPEYRFRRKI